MFSWYLYYVCWGGLDFLFYSFCFFVGGLGDFYFCIFIFDLLNVCVFYDFEVFFLFCFMKQYRKLSFRVVRVFEVFSFRGFGVGVMLVCFYRVFWKEMCGRVLFEFLRVRCGLRAQFRFFARLRVRVRVQLLWVVLREQVRVYSRYRFSSLRSYCVCRFFFFFCRLIRKYIEFWIIRIDVYVFLIWYEINEN